MVYIEMFKVIDPTDAAWVVGTSKQCERPVVSNLFNLIVDAKLLRRSRPSLSTLRRSQPPTGSNRSHRRAHVPPLPFSAPRGPV
eukprot:7281690-Pyramimonas_sp.AAC.1